MNGDQVPRQLSAALRAQASGLGIGSPAGSAPSSGLPGWAVLALAVLLGALAGGLAGVISVW